MGNAWIGMVMGLLILLASMASAELGISVALIEIGLGIVAGSFALQRRIHTVKIYLTTR